MSYDGIAACGLNCATCPLRKAPSDHRAAEELLVWLRSEGFIGPDDGMEEVRTRGLTCGGCKGDREQLWDTSCWIRYCCVDERGLDNCSACGSFPCDRLSQLVRTHPEFEPAMNRLRRMRTKTDNF